ncbi:unnamed protein product [Rotaria socialis]|nr:unnamed protein product [Rotaria socialis]
MSNTPFYINLTEQVLSYKNQSFYDLVQQQCGDVVVEIMQLQDISSVECLLEVGDIFAFLNLDSNELIQIKKKAGIFLNNGSYVLKTGILYKVQTFINILNELSRKHVNYSDRQSSNESCNLTVPEELVEKLPFIRTLITYSSLVVNSKADFTLLNILLSNMFRNLGIADKGFRYESIVRQFATALYVLGGRSAYEFLRLNIPGLLPSVQILQAAISATENNLTEGKFNYEGACNYFNSIQATLGFIAEDAWFRSNIVSSILMNLYAILRGLDSFFVTDVLFFIVIFDDLKFKFF